MSVLNTSFYVLLLAVVFTRFTVADKCIGGGDDEDDGIACEVTFKVCAIKYAFQTKGEKGIILVMPHSSIVTALGGPTESSSCEKSLFDVQHQLQQYVSMLLVAKLEA
ncbi:uncharacterized protein F5891DRAFT_979160 [Suillus fuscotomentosus]|uniref:Uncharacterized protein n=1 Tax=Suillus fuscotomentosus TaxID=1912939 RepID=A0AAD4HK05_9AGAM|nr:uncharacterized protein F5891DRAFT_980081 [Suillus fuscotomentosus]XP_041227628.1 uncharacterized protein F5891DRAFT_979160 [Suillus fuscotomentosus]KAG1900480.1 hypothetical protein F5891DRAFT_980081 [Suillus fuscotomentosus]KAG1902053.1 hypothetical protein F5891DRAFT_979160 [Suillus fuscotomentosus]